MSIQALQAIFDRLAQLERLMAELRLRIEELEARRGPGRPRKEEA